MRKNSRRSHKKTQINRRIIVIIAIVLIILSLIIILSRSIKPKEEKVEQNDISETNQEISLLFNEINKEGLEYIKPNDTVINIAVCGGVFCQNEILNAAYDEGNNEFNFYNSFHRIVNRIANADIAIATLETNFTDKAYGGTGFHNAPEELANALKLIGIDILNIATNYAFDYGEEGIGNTIKTIEQNKINVLGINTTDEAQNKILIKDIEGVRIAFLSYTYGTDKKMDIIDSYSINIIDKEKIKNDIKKAKDNNADFIFVNIHWGDYKSHTINEEQEDLTSFLVENGVDFIIGSHPIVVQPMEMRKNSEQKDVFIAYGLGNLLSSDKLKDANIGLIINIGITKSGKTEEKYLSTIEYIPVYIMDNGTNSINRYEILDIRDEIKKYQEGNKEKVSDETYELLKNALNTVENIIGGNK